MPEKQKEREVDRTYRALFSILKYILPDDYRIKLGDLKRGNGKAKKASRKPKILG